MVLATATNSMRRLLGRAFAICLIFAPSCVPALSSPLPSQRSDGQVAQAVARRMLKLYMTSGRTTPYVAEQVTQTFGQDGQRSRQIVKHGGPRRHRIEYLEPAEIRGQVLLVAGNRALHYFPLPEPRIVEQDMLSMSEDEAQGLLGDVRTGRIKATSIGSQLIAGRMAQIVEIRPVGDAPFKRLWIDSQTGVRLKQESVGLDGSVLALSVFTRIDYHPSFHGNEFAPSSFPAAARVGRITSTPPLPNLAEAEKYAGFAIKTPVLPRRFSQAGVWVSGTGRNRQVVLRYTDGVGTLVLGQRLVPNQQRLGAKPLRPLLRQSRRGVVVWTSGDRVYVLIGSVAPALLNRIVNSLR